MKEDKWFIAPIHNIFGDGLMPCLCCFLIFLLSFESWFLWGLFYLLAIWVRITISMWFNLKISMNLLKLKNVIIKRNNQLNCQKEKLLITHVLKKYSMLILSIVLSFVCKEPSYIISYLSSIRAVPSESLLFCQWKDNERINFSS